MLFHDTHVHLDILLEKLGILPDIRESSEFQIDELLQNTTKISEINLKIAELLENHDFVIHSTVLTENYLLVSNLFKNEEKIRFLIGSHPEIVDENFNLKSYLTTQKEKLPFLFNPKPQTQYFKSNRIVGIGECGLDYHYTQDKALINTQKVLFESQIQLAIENDLTLVIHCREAFSDLFSILKNFPKIHGKFLVHCFTSNTEDLGQIQDLGGKAAFGGIITFGDSAEEIRQALKFCSLESFVFETDLPFLAPKPMRGQSCFPNYIEFIGKKAAEIKNLTEQEIWKISLRNTQNLFPLL